MCATNNHLMRRPPRFTAIAASLPSARFGLRLAYCAQRVNGMCCAP
jgi:hypothetical protein